MGNDFERELGERIRSDWNRFANGQMDPDEAGRYRELLRDNQEMLDEGTRRLINERHLLDEPAAAAQPAPAAGMPQTTPLTDAARTPTGTTPFSGTGGLDDLGRAMADRDTADEVGMVPAVLGPGPQALPASVTGSEFDPSPDRSWEPGPSEPVLGGDPAGFGIPGGFRTVIVGGAVLVLVVIGGIFVFTRPEPPSTGPVLTATSAPNAVAPATAVPTVPPTPAPDFVLTQDVWHFHIGPGVSCVGHRLVMSPAIPGATGTSLLSGPGVVDAGERPLTFDAAGVAPGSTGIKELGAYTLTFKVTAGGVTKTASAPVAVGSQQGPRPCP